MTRSFSGCEPIEQRSAVDSRKIPGSGPSTTVTRNRRNVSSPQSRPEGTGGLRNALAGPTRYELGAPSPAGGSVNRASGCSERPESVSASAGASTSTVCIMQSGGASSSETPPCDRTGAAGSIIRGRFLELNNVWHGLSRRNPGEHEHVLSNVDVTTFSFNLARYAG